MRTFAPCHGLLDGRVIPRILTGNRTHRSSVRWSNRCHAYGAWVVDTGVLELGRRGQGWTRLPAPCDILIGPEEHIDLRIAPGSAFTWISFDLAVRPGFTSYGTAMPTDLSWHPPATVDLLGCRLPATIPDGSRDDFRAMVKFCAANWWRSEQAAWRAAARLTVWLADLVDTLRSQDGPAGELSLDSGRRVIDLVHTTGLSRQTIARRVRATAGCTPGRLLRDRRLDEIADLLLHSHRTIGEIASSCGYSSARSMAPAFRARFGLSPSSYRLRGPDTRRPVRAQR